MAHEIKSFQSVIYDQVVIPSLLLKKYHLLGLNEIEVMVLLQIHRFQLEGNRFPTPDEIAEFLTITDNECSTILRKLIQKNLLSIEQFQDERNILDERYSLENLWKNLYTPKVEPKSKEKIQETNIFILFEQEFGRPLSPFEIETINIWIDEEEHPPALIKAGLREAVLMGKLNFRYIDRILRDWKKKGIRSVEEARKHSKPFHTNQKSNEPSQSTTKRDVSLYYNWLEE